MRRTRQREAILTTLRDAGRPLTPAEIGELAAQDVHGINLATVYRNLKLMGEAGEVAAVDCVGQPARYEVAGLDHHHHFHCDVCDRLFDLSGCIAEELERLAPLGFEVRHHHIQLSGQCASCRTQPG